VFWDKMVFFFSKNFCFLIVKMAKKSIRGRNGSAGGFWRLILGFLIGKSVFLSRKMVFLRCFEVFWV
jgi:hypothetical protein